MRLHFIGGPASGKSSIAQDLARRLGLPVLDLDEIYWDHERAGLRAYSKRADPKARDEALAAFIRRDRWIVEGAYYRWLGPSFERADRIFVLTAPRWRRHVRVVRRFLRGRLGRDDGRRETFRGFLRVLRWNHRYDRRYLVRAAALLKELSLPFVRCSSLSEVLACLQAPAAAAGNAQSAGRGIVEVKGACK